MIDSIHIVAADMKTYMQICKITITSYGLKYILRPS